MNVDTKSSDNVDGDQEEECSSGGEAHQDQEGDQTFYRKEIVHAVTGRKIIWMGKLKESPTSGRVSSVVAIQDRRSKRPKFGQIQYFKRNAGSEVAVMNVFQPTQEDFGL